MSALWTGLMTLVASIVTGLVVYFVSRKSAAVEVAQAVAQSKQNESAAAEKLQAVAEVKHEQTVEAVKALEVERQKARSDDAVSVANSLLRDATGRRPR